MLLLFSRIHRLLLYHLIMHKLKMRGASPEKCVQSKFLPIILQAPGGRESWGRRIHIQVPWLLSLTQLPQHGTPRRHHSVCAPISFLHTTLCRLFAVWGAPCLAQGLFVTLTGIFKWSSHLGVSTRRGPGGPRPQQLQLWQQLLIRHQGPVPVLAWILQRKKGLTFTVHLLCVVLRVYRNIFLTYKYIKYMLL